MSRKQRLLQEKFIALWIPSQSESDLSFKLIMSGLILMLSTGCFDLSPVVALPCGGPSECASPRSCVKGRCVAACYQDEDCAQDEVCERQLCVPKALTSLMTAGEMTAGEMTAGEM